MVWRPPSAKRVSLREKCFKVSAGGAEGLKGAFDFQPPPETETRGVCVDLLRGVVLSISSNV